MTTIASDGKTVAADGQMTAGNEIVSRDRTKIKTHKDAILAFTGASALQDVMFTWYEEGADPAKITGCLSDQDWTLAVFRAAGVMYYRNNCPYPLAAAYPFAVGNGQDYATGAMMAGASARRAIEIACDKDIMTSGQIAVLEIPREVVSVREAAE